MRYYKSLAAILLFISGPFAVADQPQLVHDRAFFASNGAQVNHGITVLHGKVQPVQQSFHPTLAFMDIENLNSASDMLTGASCTWAKDVALVDASGSALSQVEIPAHANVSLTPAGPHLLLKSVTWPTYRGDTLICDLHFKHAGKVPVELDATPHT
jgi:copper(I)-binding protein